MFCVYLLHLPFKRHRNPNTFLSDSSKKAKFIANFTLKCKKKYKIYEVTVDTPYTKIIHQH